MVCAGGIYASYLTFGVLQEQIFKFRGGNGEADWVLLVVVVLVWVWVFRMG